MFPHTEQEYKQQLQNVLKLYVQDPQTAIRMFPYFVKEMSMLTDGHKTNPYLDERGNLLGNRYVDALIWEDVKRLRRKLLP